MKVLVTGAAGFLGRRVVAALFRRGHAVRAFDLAGPRAPAPAAIEEVRGDSCDPADLARACAGVEAVVHLAARMDGDGAEMVRTAVEGTERLVEAMARAGARRLVLASSLSVYDWAAAGGVLDEDSLLERRPEERDAYTTAKLRQEQVAREGCARAGIGLTVLRPAILWGAGREYPPTVGQRLGPVHVVIAAARPLPTAHVENAADAFAAAVDAPGAGGTFNVVDGEDITAAQFVRDHLRRSGRFGVRIPGSYALGLWAVALLARLAGPLRARLPGFAHPARFAARYRPVRVAGTRIAATLGWRPPLSYGQCLDRTYGGAAASR
jgi:nucleoside-diphosphate-sugar epimerase